jgi:hypothetical protein
MSQHPPQRLSTLFPPSMATALQEALQLAPELRPARINAITDRLVAMGLCRPRQSSGMFEPKARWEPGA